MRVNVYAEELTSEVDVVTTVADTGRMFYGIRFFLKSADELHHTEGDDDRSAVTFWVPYVKGQHRFDIMRRLVDNFSAAIEVAARQQHLVDQR